jgi:hypothetical protein
MNLTATATIVTVAFAAMMAGVLLAAMVTQL